MSRFSKILYVAPSGVSHDACLKRALLLAENNQAVLTVVDVLPAASPSQRVFEFGTDAAKTQAAMVEKRAQEITSQLKLLGCNLQVHVLVGKMYLELIRLVLRDGYDLIVKVAENPSFIERLFGSDDMHLLRKCPCPIWLMQENSKIVHSRIIAAVDFDLEAMPDPAEDELNRKILDIATSLSVSEFSELHVVHVWDAPGEAMVRSWSELPDESGALYVEGEQSRHQAALDQFREQLKDRLGKEAFEHIRPCFHLIRGAAATAIPEISRQLQTDVVVMGTLGRAGIAGVLIGNTAESILEQLQCSVVAIKPPGFSTPVTASV